MTKRLLLLFAILLLLLVALCDGGGGDGQGATQPVVETRSCVLWTSPGPEWPPPLDADKLACERDDDNIDLYNTDGSYWGMVQGGDG